MYLSLSNMKLKLTLLKNEKFRSFNFLVLYISYFSNTTRFALAANSSEKIIEPIQSRCAMLRYSRLSNPQVLAKLLDVCDKENVNYTEDGLEAIVFTAQGDMRQALNNLQVRLLYTFRHTYVLTLAGSTHPALFLCKECAWKSDIWGGV